MKVATSCSMLFIAIGLGSAAVVQKRQGKFPITPCMCLDTTIEVTDGQDYIINYPGTVLGFDLLSSKPYDGAALALPRAGRTLDYSVTADYRNNDDHSDICQCAFTLTLSVPGINSCMPSLCMDRTIEVTDGQDYIINYPGTVLGFDYLSSTPYDGAALALPGAGCTRDYSVTAYYYKYFIDICQCAFTLTLSVPDINECLSDPCFNGATCTDMVNSYQCSCVYGFTGKHCETNTNECLSDPCFNGATCTDMVNSYQCSCMYGFTGEHCETSAGNCDCTFMAAFRHTCPHLDPHRCDKTAVAKYLNQCRRNCGSGKSGRKTRTH